jgi:hypothetical protein
MWSYDVTAAYLYGKVPSGVKVYMRLPQGYVPTLPPKDGFEIALRLAKGLYGLPFSGRLWHDEFAAHLTRHGYLRDAAAPCVFYIVARVGHRQYIVLFADDFTLTLECAADRAVVEREVLSHYKITGGEPATRFVGIEIARTKQHTTLTQTAYIQAKVEEYAQYLQGSSPTTPAVESVVLTKAMCPAVGSPEALRMAELPYRGLVGSVLFAAISTRPDIAHAVSDLTRF